MGFFGELIDRISQAVTLVGEHAAEVGIGWLVIGILLHVAAQVVRVRGWHTILRTTYPEATELRARDTTTAYLAGSGLNGVIPARGGDVVKLALVHRRIPDARYSTLAATFIPETVFETVFGTGLVIWALGRGFLPVPDAPGELPSLDISFAIAHPIISSVGAVVIVALLWLLVRLLRRVSHDLVARFKQGMVIFGSPRRFITGVASWQAASRVVRLGSLAAFLAAFKLPVTLTTVVLVMAASGGGRIIPIAPVSAGLRLAMLSYGFVEVTGQAVDIAAITTFTVGVSAVVLVTGLVISLVILLRQFGTLNPRAALERARGAISAAGDSVTSRS